MALSRGLTAVMVVAGLALASVPAQAQTTVGDLAKASNVTTQSFSVVTLNRPVTTRKPSPFSASAGLPATQSTQNRAQGIGFGVAAGIGRNTASGSDADELESNTGTLLGVWVGGNKGGRIGFTGEFLYVIRKSDTEFGEFSYPALEIPAVFHVNFGRGGPEDPMGYAIVGPVFTINLKQKLAGMDVSDDFNGADFGILVGGGIEIFRFAVEARYNIGLRNITREGDVGDIKSRSFEIVAKFRISGA